MTQEKITRRNVLKAALAICGAATAAAFLPEKWVKPLVKTGVLPVHAQVSSYSLLATGEYSTPGLGIISLTGIRTYAYVPDGDVSEAANTTMRLAGTPVEGVKVTMNYRVTFGGPFTPNPALPRSKMTDADGFADFGNQNFTGEGTLYLTFTSGSAYYELGPYGNAD